MDRPAPDVRALRRWYRRVRRPLPWRFTRDPWAILVCEVMCQQTQAARVVPHWERFLARFPEPAALARASAAEAIAAWSGLGYNRRALRLREAATAVARDGWPGDAAGLRALPGVGPYTAAAVASFAYGERVAVVDTNVRRVLERHDGRRHPPAELARLAAGLLPARRPDEVNQALMELGATVCTARRRRCAECPLRRTCATAAGGVSALPPAGRTASAASRVRFRDTDRWLRGRIVAALVAGGGLPGGIEPARMERTLAGLERDGLVVRGPGEAPRLP